MYPDNEFSNIHFYLFICKCTQCLDVNVLNSLSVLSFIVVYYDYKTIRESKIQTVHRDQLRQLSSLQSFVMTPDKNYSKMYYFSSFN